MAWWWVLLLVAGLLAAWYWLVVLTEGAYLGSRVVLAIYDRFARRYDAIKRFDDAYEAFFLGEPLAQVLAAEKASADAAPLVLDVATGSGRLPLALLQAAGDHVRVVALDGSLAMLRGAQNKLADYPGVVFLRQDAARLPFAGDAFDAVTCLEALEFMPNPQAVLVELLRVLRPGGALWVTDRIGWQARLMPGKAFRPGALAALLEASGAVDVHRQPWQVDYDLIKARKAGTAPDAAQEWRSLLRCPRHQGRLTLCHQPAGGFVCSECGWQLHWQDGIWR